MEIIKLSRKQKIWYVQVQTHFAWWPTYNSYLCSDRRGSGLDKQVISKHFLFSSSSSTMQDDTSNCHSKFGEHIHFGRLDETLLAKELSPNSNKCQALICGTKSFDKDMIKYLRRLEFKGDIFKFWSSDILHTERLAQSGWCFAGICLTPFWIKTRGHTDFVECMTRLSIGREPMWHHQDL